MLPLVLAGLLLGASGRQAGAGDLYLYNWTDYHPAELLTKFEKDTGIRVTTNAYDSNEELLKNLRVGSGNYDLIVPSAWAAKLMIDEGLLQPIDAPSMPNFKNVKQRFADPWFDPGRKFTVPYMWGTTGFVYDSARVKGGKLDESWKEYFDPRPELVGKVAALDDETEVYTAAAFYLGVDPCTEDPAEAGKILDLLLAQKPKLAFYNSNHPIERMTDKTVALYQLWNGAAHRVRQRLPTAVYVYPKEGVGFWTDSFVVPVDAPHAENAKIFLNWIMDPQNIAVASNYLGYDNAIAGSEKYMDPAMIRDDAISPTAEQISRLRVFKACSRAATDLADKVWARLWPRPSQ
jgi:spermidine/putrescine transport system substrate-binding protein